MYTHEMDLLWENGSQTAVAKMSGSQQTEACWSCPKKDESITIILSVAYNLRHSPLPLPPAHLRPTPTHLRRALAPRSPSAGSSRPVSRPTSLDHGNAPSPPDPRHLLREPSRPRPRPGADWLLHWRFRHPQHPSSRQLDAGRHRNRHDLGRAFRPQAVPRQRGLLSRPGSDAAHLHDGAAHQVHLLLLLEGLPEDLCMRRQVAISCGFYHDLPLHRTDELPGEMVCLFPHLTFKTCSNRTTSPRQRASRTASRNTANAGTAPPPRSTSRTRWRRSPRRGPRCAKACGSSMREGMWLMTRDKLPNPVWRERVVL